jgi:hypothetical protein
VKDHARFFTCPWQLSNTSKKIGKESEDFQKGSAMVPAIFFKTARIVHRNF